MLVFEVFVFKASIFESLHFAWRFHRFGVNLFVFTYQQCRVKAALVTKKPASGTKKPAPGTKKPGKPGIKSE